MVGSHVLRAVSVGLQACGRLSEGSKRATNFYELEAQVKGASSLEESLVGLLSGQDRLGTVYTRQKEDDVLPRLPAKAAMHRPARLSVLLFPSCGTAQRLPSSAVQS